MMESTYVLNRFNKGLCWFAIFLSGAAIVCIVVVGVHIVHRLLAGLNPGKEEIVIGGLFLCVLFCVIFVSVIMQAAKMLHYTVMLTDESARIGDMIVTWQEIQSVDHPARTIGLAFQISMRDGRVAQVYPVEGARELEDAIAKKLTHTGAI